MLLLFWLVYLYLFVCLCSSCSRRTSDTSPAHLRHTSDTRALHVTVRHGSFSRDTPPGLFRHVSGTLAGHCAGHYASHCPRVVCDDPRLVLVAFAGLCLLSRLHATLPLCIGTTASGATHPLLCGLGGCSYSIVCLDGAVWGVIVSVCQYAIQSFFVNLFSCCFFTAARAM